MKLSTTAVAVLLVLAIATVMATTSDSAKDHWEPFAAENAAKSGVNTEKSTSRTSVHVFLPYMAKANTKNAPHVDESLTGFKRLHADLEQQRAMHGPEPEHLNGIHTWLESHGEKCEKHWDHVSCERVPVAFVEKAFKTTMALHAERARPHVMHWMSNDIENDQQLLSKLPQHLQQNSEGHKVAIFGVAPYDPTQSIRRHKSQRRPVDNFPSLKKSVVAPPKVQSATFGDDSDNSNYAWPVQNYTTAPIILNALVSIHSVQSVSLAMVCKHGDYGRSFPARNDWVMTCAGGTQPSSIKINLEGPFYAFDDARYAKNSSTPWIDAFADTTVCRTAESWNDKVVGTNVAKNTVCTLNTTKYFGSLENAARYKLTAQLKFKDNTVSDIAYFKNFNGGYFMDGGEYTVDKGLIDIIPRHLQIPSSIQKQYGVPDAEDPTGIEVEQGVIEMTDSANPGEGFSEIDLAVYMKVLKIPYFSTSDLTVVGGDTSVASDETSLDMELIMGISPGVKTTLLSLHYNSMLDSSSGSTCAQYACALLKACSDIGNGKYKATVWSLSYGGGEYLGLQTGLFEDRFRLMTRSGISFVASTGDQGAGFANQFDLIAEFPAVAPSVVGAGATAILHNAEQAAEMRLHPTSNDVFGHYTPGDEIVCSQKDQNVITTGGGYSKDYKLDDPKGLKDMEGQPYLMGQIDVVKNYTEAMREAMAAEDQMQFIIDAKYPLNRHAVPDMSAVGANIACVIGESLQVVYGTSASAPIIASFITRMNLDRVKAGKSTMKVFNQFLYSAHKNDTSSFTDITTGSNCAGSQVGQMSANFISYDDDDCYVSGKGWDPASGLGTPNYPVMASMSMKWNPHTPVPGKGDDSNHIGLILGIVFCVGVVGTIVIFLVLRSRRNTIRSQQMEQGLTNQVQYTQQSTGYAPMQSGAQPQAAPTQQSDLYSPQV